jgi:hypothetical protein
VQLAGLVGLSFTLSEQGGWSRGLISQAAQPSILSDVRNVQVESLNLVAVRSAVFWIHDAMCAAGMRIPLTHDRYFNLWFAYLDMRS